MVGRGAGKCAHMEGSIATHSRVARAGGQPDTDGVATGDSIQREQPGGTSSRLLCTVASASLLLPGDGSEWHYPICLLARDSIYPIRARRTALAAHVEGLYSAVLGQTVGAGPDWAVAWAFRGPKGLVCGRTSMYTYVQEASDSGRGRMYRIKSVSCCDLCVELPRAGTLWVRGAPLGLHGVSARGVSNPRLQPCLRNILLAKMYTVPIVRFTKNAVTL